MNHFFCFYVSLFIMPIIWEASSWTRQAILNRERFSTNTVRRDIFQRPINHKHNASLNAALLNKKPCSSRGNLVSQVGAPFSLASSKSLVEYGVLTSGCNTTHFFLSARRSFSFCTSVDSRFCLLATPSKSLSIDKKFSTRGLQRVSRSL